MITDEFLKELITCEKIVIKAERKKMLSENRSSKNSALLSSVDNKYKFRMFLRKSDEFLEDFSVGLIWTNSNQFTDINKDIILLRCQGPHDGKMPENYDIHHSFHIHQITANDIRERRLKKPSNRFSVDKFSSFEEAARFFADYCHISNIEEHFDYPFNIIELAGQTSFF